MSRSPFNNGKTENETYSTASKQSEWNWSPYLKLKIDLWLLSHLQSKSHAYVLQSRITSPSTVGKLKPNFALEHTCPFQTNRPKGMLVPIETNSQKECCINPWNCPFLFTLVLCPRLVLIPSISGTSLSYTNLKKFNSVWVPTVHTSIRREKPYSRGPLEYQLLYIARGWAFSSCGCSERAGRDLFSFCSAQSTGKPIEKRMGWPSSGFMLPADHVQPCPRTEASHNQTASQLLMHSIKVLFLSHMPRDVALPMSGCE